MSLLVVNAGSSTLKFALFSRSADEQLAGGVVDWRGDSDSAQFKLQPREGEPVSFEIRESNVGRVFPQVVDRLEERFTGELRTSPIVGTGHRVVHGGPRFRGSVQIDEEVCAAIGKLAELAPLHNPPALEAIRAAQHRLPQATHVASFDTAFFADLPDHATLLPVPYDWYKAWGVRRFGFHGISHHYCSRRAAEVLACPIDELRTVICHLGSGCSATAVDRGRAVSTTMGFTPMDGLMMGTRAGSVDPGLLFYLLEQRGLTTQDLENTLNHRSGLLGVSGVSSDYRKVEQSAAAGNEQARLALRMFIQSVRGQIGRLSTTMAGLDVLVFTAGIGTHAHHLRAEVCRSLEFMGVQIDPAANENANSDCDIAAPESPVRVLVLETREELMIARAARDCLSGDR